MAGLIRWDPFLDLYDLQRDVSRLLSRTFRDVPREWLDEVRMPATDVFTRGEDLIVRAELPGISEHDVDVSVEGHTLIVKGERREEHEVEEKDYQRREIHYGRFERRVPLPEEVDVDKIHARLEDGVLEVAVPKAAQVSGIKKVPIEKGTGKRALGRGRKIA